jgi:hypothetical protein
MILWGILKKYTSASRTYSLQVRMLILYQYTIDAESSDFLFTDPLRWRIGDSSLTELFLRAGKAALVYNFLGENWRRAAEAVMGLIPFYNNTLQNKYVYITTKIKE